MTSLPGLVAGDDELGEVLVEDVADDADGEVRLAVERAAAPPPPVVLLLAAAAGRRLGLGLDVVPGRGEALDVGAQLLLAGALGGGADDDAGRVGDDLLEDLLEPRPLGVGQLAARCRSSSCWARRRGSGPGSEICEVSRAPLCPIGSLVTWTSTVSPEVSAFSMRLGWLASRPAASQLTSPA